MAPSTTTESPAEPRVARAARAADLRARLTSLLGIPATEGNELVVLRNGNEIFPAMLDAIDAAEHTVDIVTYVYWSGDIARSFARTLAGAARRGCRVRVLLDAFGAHEIAPSLIETMTSAGAEVRRFRPFVDDKLPQPSEANHRTHRKILVCDGRVGFCGGVGIADEWDGDARNEHEWRDTHLQVRGPAVAGLGAAFLDNWADDHEDAYEPPAEAPVSLDQPGSSTCMILRASADPGATDMWRLMLALITLAEQRIRIASAYFNPDDRIIDELLAALERGVEVAVLVPGEHADKRFVQLAGEESYERLLDGGVDIRHYEPSMMHAKVITIDGAVATVGSANFNQRSMQHDEEANMILFDPDVVGILDRHFEHDVTRSRVLDPTRWADRSALQKLSERATQLVDRWI